MQMPNGYNEVKVGGDYVPPALGGHKIVIKQVVETKSKAGKNMLVVCFDFAKDDVQPNYFSEEFKNDVRPEKKWPHAGTAYILTEDQDGKCSKKLKGFVTSFERSNNCEAVWGDKFAAQFKNKKIGGVYGEVENEYNGKTTMRHELRWFCEIDKAEGTTIPDPKFLPKSTQSSDESNGFMDIKEGTDETIPWG